MRQPFRTSQVKVDSARIAGASTVLAAGPPPKRSLDPVDVEIIALLRRNARLPLKSIAGAVRLARSSVRERLQKLEASGVIRGYHARVAEEDAISAMLHLRLERTPDPAVVAGVVAMPEVRRCYSLSGAVDLSVELQARTTGELNAARDRIATLPGVAAVTTALILNRDKDE
jgi:DNA-binding Lrp family transcriptional regulator